MAFDKLYFGDLEGFLCLNDVLKHFGLPLIWGLFTPESPGCLMVRGTNVLKSLDAGKAPKAAIHAEILHEDSWKSISLARFRDHQII